MSIPLSSALPLPHTPHTPASASIPQTASASCTTWAAASAPSVSSNSSDAASPANHAQASTNTRLRASLEPPTARLGLRAARSFAPPPRFRMTLHHLPTPVNYPQRDGTLPLTVVSHSNADKAKPIQRGSQTRISAAKRPRRPGKEPNAYPIRPVGCAIHAWSPLLTPVLPS